MTGQNAAYPFAMESGAVTDLGSKGRSRERAGTRPGAWELGGTNQVEGRVDDGGYGPDFYGRGR